MRAGGFWNLDSITVINKCSQFTTILILPLTRVMIAAANPEGRRAALCCARRRWLGLCQVHERLAAARVFWLPVGSLLPYTVSSR